MFTFLQGKKYNRIQRLGATYAIKAICIHFGNRINEKVPIIWTITNKIADATNTDQMYTLPIAVESSADLITALQLIEIVAPHCDKSVYNQLFDFLPKLLELLRHPLKSVSNIILIIYFIVCLSLLCLVNSNAFSYDDMCSPT